VSAAELDRAALERLAEDWTAGWAGGDRARLEASCAPDVRYEDPVVVDPLEGLDALALHAERVRAAFPDLRVERTAAPLRDAGHACLPWRVAGTNGGGIDRLPATGRFLVLHGLHYVELSGGRIRRARGFFDLYDVAVQLGLAPGRGTLGEAAVLVLRGFGLRPRA
jgi:steroid delta-isomerase-like uncharacterized protein